MTGLRLLHLSDIHFRTPFCVNPEIDPEAGVRDLLVQDIGQIVDGDARRIDAILVSGDVAFRGSNEEYDIAAEWFDALCARIGSGPQDVYVVPGNHDVNREVCNHMMVDAIRTKIMKAQGEERHTTFHLAAEDSDASSQLLRPMEAYNEFAARYGCDLRFPDRPFWQHDLPVSDGYTLRMRGLTSTYFSGPGDDQEKDLMLGRIQLTFRTTDGVIYLAMSHHPPHWLWDFDIADDAFKNYVTISLVGHKHRQRWEPGATNVCLAAGAVNPYRNEGGWEPGYNVIDLSVGEDNDHPTLEVAARLRTWQSSPHRFVAKRDHEDKDVFRRSVPLKVKPMVGSAEQPEPDAPSVIEIEEVPVMPSPSSKSIVFRFWNLRPSQRRRITNRLGLLSSDELALPEPERYRRAFENAARREVTDALIQEIAQEGSSK